MVTRPAILIAVVAFLIRVPFLDQPLQIDDLYYMYGAQHAQIDPLHPLDTRYPFQGVVQDMRGHPHGPMNSWMLGGLLAAFGDVREGAFHTIYALFSVWAALAMFALARRFTDRALWATLLFMAVPPFIVNGNTFETDVPFLAFWLTSVVLFLKAVDERSVRWLAGAALFAAIGALQSYQAVLLVPILGVYLWMKRRDWVVGWMALLAAPAAIGAWQIFEWQTTGQLPAALLIEYMRVASLQSPARKSDSALALIGHLTWVASPVLILAVAGRVGWRWAVTLAAFAGAALVDSSPTFWISAGLGVLLLLYVLRRDFLSAWIWIFFLGCVVIFFAGAARYLLPLAAPVAILMTRTATSRVLAGALALQLAISFGLARVNYEQAVAARDFALAAAAQANGARIWANAELGPRWYLESAGALPLTRDQAVQPGEFVATNDLIKTFEPAGAKSPVSELLVVPSIPIRMISLEGGAGFSTSGKGLLPFEFSDEPVDRLRLEVVVERTPELSYIDPREASATEHFVSGIYPDGWTSRQASVVVKTQGRAGSLVVDFFIPDNAPARHVDLLADGAVIASKTYESTGAFQLSAPFETASEQVTVGVQVDATFRVPPDQRDLGIVIRGVGMR